jgi:DNA polymerase-3 subunit delta
MKLATALKEQAIIVDCSSLPDHFALSWIRTEAGRLGMRLNEDAALLLRDMAGSASLSLAKRELEKLAAYVPAGKTVGAAEVEAVRGCEIGASVFDLTAAVGTSHRERAIRILTRNLEVGEAPLRIFGSLVWQYRQLWKAKDLLRQGGSEVEAARILRMPPFKVREFLKSFSESHLNAAFKKFLETDSQLKGGSVTAPARILEALLLDLCGRDKGLRSTGERKAAAGRPQTMAVSGGRNIRTVRSVRPSPR